MLTSSRESRVVHIESNVALLKAMVLITAVKLLLIESYKSTDFEVHRNWLAITSSLPLNKWYVDETSPWTLDYPPLFAWFEFLLSRAAGFFDPEMLRVENLEYSSLNTVLFQRLSVILVDLVIIGATWFASMKTQLTPEGRFWFFVLVLSNAGLLMVDHIHFQYNGFLIGILLWSVLCIEQDQCLCSALLFSMLLNLKHLFLYSAPVFFAYLLKSYCCCCCLQTNQSPFLNFCKLGACVILVFIASFGPFIFHGQFKQILSRLFPFGRGLCHAYWAPNIWALYAFLDKILSIYLSSPIPATTTRGLVGSWKFAVLFEINPAVSLLLVLLFATLPAILQFYKPSSRNFMECVAYANLSGFIWGYHVHEKAILPVLIPLLFVAFRSNMESLMNHTDHFMFFSTLSHYSLTPLLFQPQEYPIKFLLIISYALLVAIGFKSIRKEDKRTPSSTIQRMEVLAKWSLILTILVLELIQLAMNCMKIQTHYEFLPLMLTSVLCSIGITYYWIKWTGAFLFVLFRNLKKPKTT